MTGKKSVKDLEMTCVDSVCVELESRRTGAWWLVWRGGGVCRDECDLWTWGGYFWRVFQVFGNTDCLFLNREEV